MSYTTIESVQARTGVTYTGAELAYVTILLSAVDKYIDKYTNRTFTKVAGGVKYYHGNNTRELEIDDLQAVSSILEYDMDGDLVDTFTATDYELRPYNTTPKTHIKLLNGTWCGYKYKITGDWGYSETCPADISMVATEIIANVMSQKGGIKSESIEGYSYALGQVVTENPVFATVLDGYKKILI